MIDIQQNLKELKGSLPPHVELVAVSKTKSEQEIRQAYNAGQRIFGENKIQEMTQKSEVLPDDIAWHMIGHVQSNKVKYMAPYVSLIHGVDSMKLLKEIDKQGKKNGRILRCLIQVHIAEETTKFGFLPDEVLTQIAQMNSYDNAEIAGLMGMATNTDDMRQIQKEFGTLRSLYSTLKNEYNTFKILSMGMSGDYQIAIAEGSTMIQVGSKIFGPRNY